MTFTVPGLPPSKSNGYRAGGGRFFKSSKVITYEKVFQLSTLKVPKHTFLPSDRLAIHVEWTPPHLRSDIDGILKVLLDQCQKTGIIENDNKVDFLRVERLGVDKLNYCVKISIEKWFDREE